MPPLPLEQKALQSTLETKVAEVAAEPEYTWADGFKSYMSGDQDRPLIRVAMVNFKPGLDIWEGLRSPARAGNHPLTARDIWDFYAANNIQRTRFDGSANFLAMPETLEEALSRFKRVVVVSAMLAVNPEVYDRYAEKIKAGDQDPLDLYVRATTETANIIDRAVSKLAFGLMAPERVVVPMTSKNSQAMIDRTRAEYQKGAYHGPCNDNWPHNSVAVMAGLLKHGVSRLPFRDEVDSSGRVRRIFGRYRSIVIFDPAEPSDDRETGLRLLGRDRLARLRRISDYTESSQDILEQRYCTYNLTSGNGKSACARCISECPSGALANSSPRPDGSWPEEVARQTHRFWEGAVKFDFQNCTSDRYQKAQVYEDYVCARCEAVCAALGVRKSAREVEKINQA